MVEIQAFFDEATATVSYLVWDPASRDAAIIDPVLDYEPHGAALTTISADAILRAAEAKGVQVAWVLDTHAHADHLSAADYIRTQTRAKIGIGSQITEVQSTFKTLFDATDVAPDGAVFDALFNDGDTFTIGSLTARVLHTPGHTPACLTYVIDDAAFVGDTLFMPDYGTARTDFPGGDAAMLYRSIQRILDLPAATRIFVGHDYPPAERKTPAWETTVAAQRADNVHVGGGVSEDAFVQMREARDATLGPPRLILPSLQVNIRAGALPPPELNGKVFLKLPINALR